MLSIEATIGHRLVSLSSIFGGEHTGKCVEIEASMDTGVKAGVIDDDAELRGTLRNFEELLGV